MFKNKRIKGSDYYSDKGFVLTGVGLLSIFTRIFYMGNTSLGKVFLVFGLLMCFLGICNCIKYLKCKRVEQQFPMTTGYAMYLFKVYINRNVKRTDTDTVQHIKALQYVLDYLEQQGFEEEIPTEMNLLYSTEKNNKTVDIENNSENTGKVLDNVEHNDIQTLNDNLE